MYSKIQEIEQLDFPSNFNLAPTVLSEYITKVYKLLQVFAVSISFSHSLRRMGSINFKNPWILRCFISTVQNCLTTKP